MATELLQQLKRFAEEAPGFDEKGDSLARRGRRSGVAVVVVGVVAVAAFLSLGTHLFAAAGVASELFELPGNAVCWW